MNLRVFGRVMLAGLSSLAFAQEEPHGTGLNFDLPSYRGTPYKAALTEQSYANLPASASLEQYCPTPGDQGRMGTCVAFATAYHMRTVLYGIQHHITNRAQLDAAVFSPTFIYEQIKSPEDRNCQGGTNPIQALELMKTSGVSQLSRVPYLCGASINSEALLEAVDFTINDYQVLFMPEVTDRNVRVNTVRKAVAEGYPVVLCFTVVKSFYDSPSVWHSLPSDGGAEGQHGRHAMLVVGYDNDIEGGCFRVLNSWSPKWADHGFVWVRYDDFAKYALGAIQVYGPRAEPNPVPAPRPGQAAQVTKAAAYHLKGEVFLKERDGAPMEAHRIITEGDVVVADYRLDQTYPSGTRFRFFINTNTETYLYAFATDLTGQVNRILPFEDGMSPLIGPDSTIAFPSEKKVVKMDEQKGTDYLAILYTDRPLNAKDVLGRLNAASGSLSERLRSALGGRLIAPSRVNYPKNRIAFEVEQVAPGGVVPLMIEIPHG